MASGTHRDGRIYVREVSSKSYSLVAEQQRRQQRGRVRHALSADAGLHLPLSPGQSASEAWWALSPADEEFLTQSLEVHFRELPPGQANSTHGHQNEALFYWLEGSGHDDHDGERFEWRAGDVVFVPVDTVHRHVNDSTTERALALVIKAKALWMHLGLFAQGPVEPWAAEAGHEFGPRVDWSAMWTRGLADGETVVHAGALPWVQTDRGLVCDVTSSQSGNHRNSSVDLYVQRVPGSGWSSRHLHMADEVLFVLSGHGTIRQWEVRPEIADRYYARVGERATEWRFGPGDLVYVPPTTAHQIVADDGDDVEILCAHSRAFAALGYGGVVTLEPASGCEAVAK